jgi:tyrosine-protein kinase Etk/Wzc
MDWYMDAFEQEKDTVPKSIPFPDDDIFDVLDILLVLARRRRMIGLATLVALFAGAIVLLLLKPNFTATAIILPPQQSSSSSALLNQLDSLASLGGGPTALGLKTPADMYVGILQSRTIADEIISKFQLQTLYKQKKLQDARTALKDHTEIETGKDGLIRISVTDHDPGRARDIANAYVNELYGMNSNLAITEAAQRRVFFDQQLDIEKKALALAEEDLRATQQRTGLIQISGQALTTIQAVAQLRAEIASREVELQSVETFATEQNPEVNRLKEEISAMHQQLAKLENDQEQQVRPGNIALPAARVAEDTLEYSRKLREVKYHDTLFDLLSRQYEAARIDEARSAPIIQVIDHAVAPDKKSGPKRALILAAFVAIGFVFASMFAFAEHGIGRIKRVPEQAVKWQDLKSQFH